MRHRAFSAVLFLSLILVGTVSADDWPQWRGPGRDNLSKETGLLKEWPKSGPELVWTFRDGGHGYSCPVVVGDRVYCMGDDEKNQFIFALSAKDGKEIWRTPFASANRDGRGGGPRGTPTVAGDYVYGIGGSGTLICVKASDGKEVWSKSFSKDFGGKRPGWGFAESPLVDGDKVICTPGGKGGAIVALNAKTGDLIWRSSDVNASATHSSIVVAEPGGMRQYVQQVRGSVVGVNAKDGKLLWQIDKSKAHKCPAVVPTPIVEGNLVYATNGYGSGESTLIKLKADDKGGVESSEAYVSKDMINKHGGVLLYKGHIYGHHDRVGWICQNFKTGEKVWPKEGRQSLGGRASSGSLTYADDRLYLYSEAGTVGLIDASTEGWKLRGEFELPERSKIRAARGKNWTHPVVANGKLYIRDQELLFCFDVKGK